jgi:hypothetical protein
MDMVPERLGSWSDSTANYSSVLSLERVLQRRRRRKDKELFDKR